MDWPYFPWLAGAAAGWMLATLIVSWRSNRTARNAYRLGLHAESSSNQEQQQHLDVELTTAHSTLELLRGRLEYLQDNHRELQRASLANDQQLTQARTELATSNAQLAAEQRALAQQRETLVKTGAALKQEFQGVAQELFSQLFTSQGQAQELQLGSLLKPFREQLTDFRRRVDEVYQTDTKERASLLTEMKNLHSASERINQEAANLTTALKGDKKLQGNWGEMVLERVLEQSGLRAGVDFHLQPARRNVQGDLKRPDVIVRLPENKDIVVDSKVSLNAYERAVVAEDDSAVDAALTEHVRNLRQHAKRLGDQDYSELVDVRSLDFVLMFVPIESAFAAAMAADSKLFTDAFNQRVVIVSPSTLMLCLRIVHNLWRFENQDRNAQEIATKAGLLYDKLRGLVEEFEVMEKQLQTVDKTFANIKGKLVHGKGNLVSQVENFRQLGAPVKKPFSESVLERAINSTNPGSNSGSSPNMSPAPSESQADDIVLKDKVK